MNRGINNIMTYKPKMKKSVCILSKQNRKVYVNTKENNFIQNSTYDILKHCDGTNDIHSIGYKLSIDYQACVDYNYIKDVIIDAYVKDWLE